MGFRLDNSILSVLNFLNLIAVVIKRMPWLGNVH